MARNRFDDAISVQGACNLQGVASSLLEHINQCREEKVDDYAKDPAIRLMVYQMAHLAGVAYGFSDYHDCLKACEDNSPRFQADLKRLETIVDTMRDFDLTGTNKEALEAHFRHPVDDGRYAISGTVQASYDLIRIECVGEQLNAEQHVYEPTGWGLCGNARTEAKEFIVAARDAIMKATDSKYVGVSCKNDPGLF